MIPNIVTVTTDLKLFHTIRLPININGIIEQWSIIIKLDLGFWLASISVTKFFKKMDFF